MIERIIAFALHQRFITVALALILTIGGIASYLRLPIEAYPDIGDVKVEVITRWPGHAAEEVERLLTITLENELNGITTAATASRGRRQNTPPCHVPSDCWALLDVAGPDFTGTERNGCILTEANTISNAALLACWLVLTQSPSFPSAKSVVAWTVCREVATERASCCQRDDGFLWILTPAR
jgi:hypothetical protein